jgi:hypothetical protein
VTSTGIPGWVVLNRRFVVAGSHQFLVVLASCWAPAELRRPGLVMARIDGLSAPSSSDEAPALQTDQLQHLVDRTEQVSKRGGGGTRTNAQRYDFLELSGKSYLCACV